MHKHIATIAARLLLVIGWIALMASQATTTQAQSVPPVNPGQPQLPGTPPQVPGNSPQNELQSTEEVFALNGKGLKAVIFVGPIDGDTGAGTMEQITYAQQTAATLRAYGVTVHEFYPNAGLADWASIKTAANGAHILIYRGHGVSISNTVPLHVGGFWLKNNEYVSSDQIRTELRPAKNFIVMIFGSYTAGSTSGDTTSIGAQEATRRVAMYSDPFFDIGAGAYYADWFGDAFTSYTNSLFQGRTHRHAYVNFYDFNQNQMWYGSHPDHPNQHMWLGWDEWYDPKPQWNNVFIGQPDLTLYSMFGIRAAKQSEMLFVPAIVR